MRRYLFVSLATLLALAAGSSRARAADAEVVSPAPNAVYFELAGTCVLGSFNYERRFADAWPLRVGVGAIPPTSWNSFVVTPAVTMGRLFGSGGHSLELAAGATGWYSRSQLGVLAAGVLGYRYQPPGSGVVFRLAFTPLVTVRNPPGQTLSAFAPQFGLSVGKAW